MNFQPVSEPKVGKVRIHVDVLVDDLDAAVARVVALGGADTSTREHLPRGRIAVMQDPEGNEFCLLAPPAP
jgi:predicted enzyme related to lactoylglutathione lyase